MSRTAQVRRFCACSLACVHMRVHRVSLCARAELPRLPFPTPADLRPWLWRRSRRLVQPQRWGLESVVTGRPSVSTAGRGGQASQGPQSSHSHTHSYAHTHLSQAHVCACSHTPACTCSYMPRPHMPSNAHTDSLSCSHSHTCTGSSTRVHAHVHSYTRSHSSPSHTPACTPTYSETRTDSHMYSHTPSRVLGLRLALQGLRGPSVGGPVPWARQLERQSHQHHPTALHPSSAGPDHSLNPTALLCPQLTGSPGTPRARTVSRPHASQGMATSPPQHPDV